MSSVKVFSNYKILRAQSLYFYFFFESSLCFEAGNIITTMASRVKTTTTQGQKEETEGPNSTNASNALEHAISVTSTEQTFLILLLLP